MNSPTTRASNERFLRWSRLLSQFLSGQACIQAVNFLTGLALLRWLTKEDYAQFSVAFAFQSTLNSLVDLGFSGSIVALVGEHKMNSTLIGNYIKSAQSLRARLSIVGILLSCVTFPVLTLNQGWSQTSVGLLLVAIIVAVLLQSRMIYSAPLLIHGQLTSYYRPQVVAATARLAICALLYLSGLLSAGTAACVAAVATGINGFLYRRNAAPLIKEPSSTSKAHTVEMLKYLAPLIPGVVFMSLQGQIVIVLITWFGKTTNIAEVAALGRLGQIFLLLGALNAVVIEPYIAAVSAQKLVWRYGQILSGSVGVAGVLCVLGFLYPAPLLWILGPKYSGLELEVGWAIASACIAYVGGVMWTMNSARRWLFWWSTILYVSILMTVNVLCIMFMNLSTTMGVLHFSFLTALSVLVVHISTAIYGFIKVVPLNASQLKTT